MERHRMESLRKTLSPNWNHVEWKDIEWNHVESGFWPNNWNHVEWKDSEWKNSEKHLALTGIRQNGKTQNGITQKDF
jgi:hypothetical protein